VTTLLTFLRRIFAFRPALPLVAHVPGFEDPSCIVLNSESASEWQTHLSHYIDAFAPVNYPETELVQMIACITWRLSRLTAVETSLLNHSQPVPDSLYQAIATLQNGYRTAVEGMTRLHDLTKPPSQAGGSKDDCGKKVVILVKQPEVRRIQPGGGPVPAPSSR
jgi:hypothetical protein